MFLTWEAAAALCAIIAAIIGGQVALIRSIVKIEMARMLDALDKRYVGTSDCDERHKQETAKMLHRIQHLEAHGGAR